VACLSGQLRPGTTVNSGVLKDKGQKNRAGFAFQNIENVNLFFYKYHLNFPKFFLRKNVEK
jgi:hypothetical protein